MVFPWVFGHDARDAYFFIGKMHDTWGVPPPIIVSPDVSGLVDNCDGIGARKHAVLWGERPPLHPKPWA